MNQQHFGNWSEMTKRIQEPLQELADLNMKTLNSLTYLKPEELIHFKKPEAMLEKQVNLAIENGHKALDYMQKSFHILEKAVMGLVNEAQKVNEEKK